MLANSHEVREDSRDAAKLRPRRRRLASQRAPSRSGSGETGLETVKMSWRWTLVLGVLAAGAATEAAAGFLSASSLRIWAT